MQHVAVKFNAESDKTYTYHNEGDPVQPGDRVVIGAGARQKTVIVHSVRTPSSDDPPLRFETKAIVGLAPPEEDKAP